MTKLHITKYQKIYLRQHLSKWMYSVVRPGCKYHTTFCSYIYIHLQYILVITLYKLLTSLDIMIDANEHAYIVSSANQTACSRQSSDLCQTPAGT